ncbi:MAG: 3-phosphoshikimate 1-carboxyvinyltransferase [Verrucomicrobia bacterium]|nr:3-phosphoshikimate 1-carboxyvinyltransferase [Verrucomicrobiota bacterium]
MASASAIGGRLRVPGDKSISHRVAMLSAIASGTSEVSGFLCSEDCLNTLSAMAALGAMVRQEDGLITIEGTGGTLHAPQAALDLGNSGTGIRLLAGLLAGQPFEVEMVGDVSLQSRPMGRIQKPLEAMGAHIELLGEGGCAPIRIEGGVVNPIRYALPMASAQVKSAVLLAGLAAHGETVVVEPRATRDHTERMLMAMGADLSVDGLSISLRRDGLSGPVLKSGVWHVPGDFSSAAFWITAAAASEGCEVIIEGVGLNPRRTALLDVLRRMGASIECHVDASAWEPTGSIVVRGARLHGTEVGGDEIPNLIDELPLVGVAGALAEGVTVIRDAAELRVKESDRIATMVTNLSAVGVAVDETDDGMHVTGGRVAGGVAVKSYGDHRIAMAMAVLGLYADRPVQIDNVACVATSYPEFWDDMGKIAEHDK